jgi:hypothetical protein
VATSPSRLVPALVSSPSLLATKDQSIYRNSFEAAERIIPGAERRNAFHGVRLHGADPLSPRANYLQDGIGAGWHGAENQRGREKLYSSEPPATCRNCGLAWSL